MPAVAASKTSSVIASFPCCFRASRRPRLRAIGLSSEQSEAALALPHDLLVDVTVDAQGQMVDYQILAGPRDRALRRQLDQILLFSRFRPMMSFGRPTSGGHVVLSFTEVRVKG